MAGGAGSGSSDQATSAGILVYLYGPPAVGKLTVAERLASITGVRLFHNHLTVNAVASIFEFGSEPYNQVLHRVRLDVFATAAQAGIDLIFTNNSAWGGHDGRGRFATFAEQAAGLVSEAGGQVLSVQLIAPQAELERRLADDSRRRHGKLLDVDRHRELLADHDPRPLHTGDLRLDTSELTPDEAARRIAAELHRRLLSRVPG